MKNPIKFRPEKYCEIGGKFYKVKEVDEIETEKGISYRIHSYEEIALGVGEFFDNSRLEEIISSILKKDKKLKFTEETKEQLLNYRIGRLCVSKQNAEFLLRTNELYLLSRSQMKEILNSFIEKFNNKIGKEQIVPLHLRQGEELSREVFLIGFSPYNSDGIRAVCLIKDATPHIGIGNEEDGISYYLTELTSDEWREMRDIIELKFNEK